MNIKQRPNIVLGILATVFLAIATSSPPLVGQDATPRIIRPAKVKSKVEGAQIAKPGDYTVTVGNWLQLEYSYPVTPQAIPRQLRFKLSNDELFDTSEPVVRDVVAPGMVGASTKAFCFRALNPGSETVKLSIDDNEYTYVITIEASEDKAEPEMCSGVYSAIQVGGKVYVFANGIHPSAGYETFLQKADIAIWPPEHILMCRKPAGVAAQVVSMFSVHTSFNAAEPVKAVFVTDSGGKKTIPVIQIR